MMVSRFFPQKSVYSYEKWIRFFNIALLTFLQKHGGNSVILRPEQRSRSLTPRPRRDQNIEISGDTKDGGETGDTYKESQGSAADVGNSFFPPPPTEVTFYPLYEIDIVIDPFSLTFAPTESTTFTENAVDISANFISIYTLKNFAVEIDELLSKKFVVERVDVQSKSVHTDAGNTIIEYHGKLLTTSPLTWELSDDEVADVNALIATRLGSEKFKAELLRYMVPYVGNDISDMLFSTDMSSIILRNSENVISRGPIVMPRAIQLFVVTGVAISYIGVLLPF